MARSLDEISGRAREVGRLLGRGGAEPAALSGVSGLSPLVIDAGARRCWRRPGVGGGPHRAGHHARDGARPRARRGGMRCTVGPEPILRREPGGGGGRRSGRGERPGPLLLPESRMGAHLALGGREARGELGRAIAVLADRCEGPPV